MSDTHPEGTPQETSEAAPAQAAGRAWPHRLTWGVFGVLVIIGSIDLGLGELREPGPGFWPLVSGLMILLASFALRPPKDDEPRPEAFSNNPWRLVSALVSVAAFITAFAAVGLVLPVLALLVLWLRALAGMRWWTTLVTAVVVTAALAVGLVYGLGVPLPSDPLIALLEGTG
ncbi:tripartite tricarboxylate transporter TctB family protein [Nocardiopsis salina]|uniref:tripartite tricarboxylate transporter TctB family protein n=1 Tax=Nocardiopsis salina TaxID=245836 RepID=UPI000349740B|nr:tripartite tricarboxylate transporter TctB family protein [Nocardiopsis salina]